jgi:hypothetical protein
MPSAAGVDSAQSGVGHGPSGGFDDGPEQDATPSRPAKRTAWVKGFKGFKGFKRFKRFKRFKGF